MIFSELSFIEWVIVIAFLLAMLFKGSSPLFATVWRGFRLFGVILLIILTVGFASGEVKKWLKD